FLFRLNQSVLTTPTPVLMHSRTFLTAKTTRLLVMLQCRGARLISDQVATTTQPAVLLRSFATPLAARTRPWVWKPSLATQQPAITLPLAPMHSPSTLRVALTRPPESMPCGSSSCL